jgi:hypothetical protein
VIGQNPLEAVSHTHLAFCGHVGTRKIATTDIAMVNNPSRMKILRDIRGAKENAPRSKEEYSPLPPAFTSYAVHLSNNICKDT